MMFRWSFELQKTVKNLLKEKYDEFKDGEVIG
jgi:hypothetical protein